MVPHGQDQIETRTWLDAIGPRSVTCKFTASEVVLFSKLGLVTFTFVSQHCHFLLGKKTCAELCTLPALRGHGTNKQPDLTEVAVRLQNR